MVTGDGDSHPQVSSPVFITHHHQYVCGLISIAQSAMQAVGQPYESSKFTLKEDHKFSRRVIVSRRQGGQSQPGVNSQFGSPAGWLSQLGLMREITTENTEGETKKNNAMGSLVMSRVVGAEGSPGLD